LTVFAASILITCAAQHYMCCPTLHLLPNITFAAQHYICCPTLHVLPNITCAAQRNLSDFINLTIFFSFLIRISS
jgi:hypothetical protein